VDEARRLILATPAGVQYLTLDIQPATQTLTAQAGPGVWHYYRWAEATLRPQPPAPPPFTLARGDAYLALSPAAQTITDSATIARFVHLRDYFNAAKLATTLWEHLGDQVAPAPLPMGLDLLVIEAR
jgi:hypothetical protein